MLKSTAIRSARVSELSCLSFCQRTPRTYSSILAWSICKNHRPFTVNSTRHFSTSLRRYFPKEQTEGSKSKPTIRENIYTIPNLLTTSRIFACPVLGWSILDGNYYLATGLLVYAGLTDLADGYLARRFKMSSVLGTILDPAADKALMTTLTVTLTMQGLIPVPLAVIILGRDVLLSLSAFYIRYSTLPNPKTFSRYWDFSLPSAEVRPTGISKASILSFHISRSSSHPVQVNTALQLLLMGMTTVSPILPIDIELQLHGLQWLVATTTIWSGLSYVFTKDAVRVVVKSNKHNSP
ncbi:hypothetical protein M413DRAFT_353710 [Hebeloma cylindrosporum]|uniref:CDP-diacylglycerol--glycerol-3-phosphate 3-phosphatidyltransferase n=1 Tax=Hebeloma cylindrosporum TaxID=76867 RepID=A0A0C2Y3M3_HEBCY|nr:hypothetical protein M413DRAFT_353710 [Hebeloma cylindrosporum h7]